LLFRGPDLRRDARDDIRIQIALQRFDDREVVPARAEHVDAVGWTVFEEGFLREIVNRFLGELAGVLERHFDALHRSDFEAAVLEKLREAPVHIVLKISDADELLDAERAE